MAKSWLGVLVQAALLLGAVAGCDAPPVGGQLPPPASRTNHPWFPLDTGNHAYGKAAGPDGVISCESCHPASAASFQDVRCNDCHQHRPPFVARLHLGEPTFDGGSAGCYACHPAGEKVPFHHVGIEPNERGGCAECHGEATAFARLPRADGQPHLAVTGDCGGCHQRFDGWGGATGAEDGRFDPARDLALTGYLPTFAGTSVTRLQPLPQTLHMPMNHRALDAGVASGCVVCHAGVDPAGGNGSYFPGELHAALDTAGLPQPARCAGCHEATEPVGFVGRAQATRSPQGPAMRHDAVAWDGGAPTATRLVPAECSVCHASPERVSSLWSVAQANGAPPAFHAPLAAASLPQPGSCLDCHANSRPVTLLTSASAALPAGLVFDHALAQGECASCHAGTSSWAGGRFHASQPAPGACLPCHEGERPVSTAGWVSTTYTRSPFDYVPNDAGLPHGAGEDCAACHGASTSTWAGGSFPHGPGTVAATTCAACHLSQRPAAAVQGFDHLLNGMGDCRACHQATVTAGRYVDYVNPTTGALPGGDWRGGREYPADVLVTSQSQFITLTQYTLQRDAGFVTGMTSGTGTFFNAMLHTSAALPAELDAGTAAAPNTGSCWHCHTHVDGVVTSYVDGQYHAALTQYRATPDAGVTPLPQPTARCLDCHEPMRPGTLVMKGASPLVPMDHSVRFTAAVTLGGRAVTSVREADCSACHASPGAAWSDGVFHARIGAAQPVDCVSCHYPLMASASADVTAGTTYAMKHRSPQLQLQACDTCHPSALGKASTTPAAAALWRTGALHAKVSPQPTACLDCHAASEPAAATQGTVVWAFSAGGTATNGGQWMNHAVAAVTARDCAACHQADAKTSGSAWSKATLLHQHAPSPGACATCHGTANGRGAVIGTNNNLPATLVDSKTTTTSSASPGVKDQLSHADVNVTGRDCGACHTLTTGAAAQDWHAARFHANFTAAAPLVSNGTTGRCSSCHLNVKPGPAFTAWNHGPYTAASGSQDCASCHAFPGTSATTPNWLGATGAHAATGSTAGSTLDCNTACHGQNGTAAVHLATPAATHFGGVNNGNGCISCHINFAGFKGTIANLKYAHTNPTANLGNGCGNCHAFAAQLYTTMTTTPPLTYPTVPGGHQFSQARSVTGTFNGDSFTGAHTGTKFNLCGSCHQYSATTATTNVWTFRHRPTNPGITSSKSTSGCNNCH